MLTTIRNKFTGWALWALVVLICVPFAFWGVSSYLEGGSSDAIATIDGEEIPRALMQREYDRQLQFFTQQNGGAIDPSVLEAMGLRENIIDGLVSNRVMENYARAERYTATDQQLIDGIKDDPNFQVDGAFDADLYQRVLRSNGYTAASYEQSLRARIAINQLRDGVLATAFTTPAEQQRILDLQSQKYDADYVVLDTSGQLAEVSVDEQDLRQRYDDNPDSYQSEERIKVSYIELNIESLADNLDLSDEDLSIFFEQNKTKYVTPESRSVSHILLTLAEDADEDTKQSVINKADEIFTELSNGGDFAALVEAHSEDAGSKQQAGKLGIVTRGQMPEAFEEAVFALGQGEFSEPVLTPFGYHIILLDELTAAREKTLDEVRDEVVAAAKLEQATNLYTRQLGEFETLVFEFPDGLEDVAEQLNLTIKETEWFTRSQGEGIAANPAFRSAAFNEDVLLEDTNSTALSLQPTQTVAMHLLAHEPAALRAFEDVKPIIEEQAKNEAARERLTQQIDQWVDDLSVNTTSWQQVIEQSNSEAETLASLRSVATGDQRFLWDAMSAANKPGDEPAYGKIQLGENRFALYQWRGISQGDAAELDETYRTQLQAQLQQQTAQSEYASFQQALRSLSDVVIKP